MKASSIQRHILGCILLLIVYGSSNIAYQLHQEEDFTHVPADITTPNYSPIWPSRKSLSDWCYYEENPYGRSNQELTNPGLLFVKIPKTASSTLAGINIRIAHKVGERILPKLSSLPFGGLRSVLLSRDKHQESQVCSHTKTHGREMLLQRKARGRKQPLVWSFVRDPVARTQSAFLHFEVSRKGVTPTLGHLVSYASDQAVSNFQYKYLSTDANPQSFLDRYGKDSTIRDKIIQDQILKKYDFIGIVERWEESLAVMILLWNLQFSDVIVLPSKVAGCYDDGRYQTAGNCKKIQSAESLNQSPEDKEYLESFWNTTFASANEYDYRLYQMANEKLSRTIQELGAKRVQAVVQKIQKLQALSTEHCSSEAIFPCSSNGTWQYTESTKNCYWLDSGCGYPCIDQLFSKHLRGNG